MSRGGRRPSSWRLLTNRHRFGLFILGAMMSNTGTWCQNVAAIIVVYQLTGDFSLVALVTVAQYSLVIVFGPYAGVVVDRYDRRTVLMICQLGGVAASLALMILISMGNIEVISLFIFIAFLGCVQAFQSPAMLSFTPQLVNPNERDLGLSLNAMQFNLARVIGPVIATGIVAFADVAMAFLANGLSYGFFLIALLLIRPRPEPLAVRTRGMFRSGAQTLLSLPRVRVLLLVGLVVYGATDAVNTLGPAVSIRLIGDEALLGVFIGAFGVGAVTMAFLGVPWLRSFEVVLVPVLSIAAISVWIFAIATNVIVAVVASFVFGAVFLAAGNRALTLIQDAAPPGLLGRVTALWVVAINAGRVVIAGIESIALAVSTPEMAGAVVGSILIGLALLLVLGRRWGVR